MKRRFALAAVIASISLVPMTIRAQGGAAATAATRLATPAATGPASALTRAASAVRASRAAALAGRATQAANAGLSKSTQIMGYLWTANNGAITEASVQIRNTVTNTIEAVTKTNAAGEFVFQNVNPGEYMIEYVADSAKKTLLALGHPFTVSPGETVATFVRLSNGLPMLLPNELGNLASNAASQAVTSAATQGVTAVATPLVQIVPPVIPPSGDPPAPPPTVISSIK
jgi:hypothetical protein